jgi:hypothetical protein
VFRRPGMHSAFSRFTAFFHYSCPYLMLFRQPGTYVFRRAEQSVLQSVCNLEKRSGRIWMHVVLRNCNCIHDVSLCSARTGPCSACPTHAQQLSIYGLATPP